MRKHKNCLKCQYVPCINFYHSSNELEGAELFFLKRTIKQKLQFPCTYGSLILSLCKISSPFKGLKVPNPIFRQCVRDLRVSAFLLLCGHYRSAMQILRPTIENYLAGMYFDAKYVLAKDDSDRNLARKDFQKFLRDKFEIPLDELRDVFPNKNKFWARDKKVGYTFLLEWLAKRGLIDSKVKGKFKAKIRLLNKYLHPYYGKTEISKPDCSLCFASVTYREEDREECTELWQDVVAYLLFTFYTFVETFFPKHLKEKEVASAIRIVTALEGLEKEVTAKIIFSEDLRRFASDLHKSC